MEIIENRVALGNEADMGLIRVGNEDHRITAFEFFQKIFRNQDFRNEYVRPYFAERLEIHLETAVAAQVLVELRGRYPSCFVTAEQINVSENGFKFRGGTAGMLAENPEHRA